MCQCQAPRSPDFTQTHSIFQPNSQKGCRLLLLREEATRSVCPAALASQGRGPQSPGSWGSPGSVLGPQPWDNAAPWSDTLERSAGALQQQRLRVSPGQPVLLLTARSLPSRHDAGVLADRQQGPQESHSHDYWRSQARSWGSGQTLGTRRKGQTDKSQEPPACRAGAPPAGARLAPWGRAGSPMIQGQGEPKDTPWPRGHSRMGVTGLRWRAGAASLSPSRGGSQADVHGTSPHGEQSVESSTQHREQAKRP